MKKRKPSTGTKDAEILRLLLKHGAKPEEAFLEQKPDRYGTSDSLMDKVCYYMCSVQDKNLAITFIEHAVPRRRITKVLVFFLMQKMNETEAVRLIKALALPSDHGKVNFQEDLSDEWAPGVRSENCGLSLHILKHNVQDSDWVQNITYLGWATILGQKEVVKCLLDPSIGGVVPNDIELTMCLLEASLLGRVDIISVLLNGYIRLDQKRLHRFAIAGSKAGHTDVLTYWMNFGLKQSTLQEKDEQGNHILSNAIKYGKGPIVVALGRMGIMLTTKAVNSLTLARLSDGRQKLMKKIIMNNDVASDVGQKHNTRGNTYLHCPKIAAYLALYGFSIDTSLGWRHDPVAWQRVREIQNKAKKASLFNSCVNTVRGCLGPNLSKKVKSLPLPKLIKDELFKPKLRNLPLTDIFKFNTDFTSHL